MIISGLQKVTLLDYPGHIAATIFLGHCNLRCPFCHNMELVLNPSKFPRYNVDDIIKFLRERKGKLNGVAITGGEPLLNDDIESLLLPIKELGYKIKLDTNGFFPERIESLILDKLVDKFAMDIKAGFSNYLNAIGVSNNVYSLSDVRNKIEKSIYLLINKSDDYEFRTTCVRGIHIDEDFNEISDMIKGAKCYFLQNYKAAPGMEDLAFKPFERDELEYFKSIVENNIQSVELRGI